MYAYVSTYDGNSISTELTTIVFFVCVNDTSFKLTFLDKVDLKEYG